VPKCWPIFVNFAFLQKIHNISHGKNRVESQFMIYGCCCCCCWSLAHKK
jgi:hypothetical protein